MKRIRLIESDAANGDLVRSVLLAAAQQYGTPCYVYFLDPIYRRINSIRARIPEIGRICFAVKSNPNSALLRRLCNHVDLLDVSSAGEIALAIQSGWTAERLSLTGPGKRAKDLQAAIDHRVGWVVLESVDEARRLNSYAANSDQRSAQRVLIRVTLDAELVRSPAVDSPIKFGIEQDGLPDALRAILCLPDLNVEGFHIYSGGQCLDADAIVENLRRFVETCRLAISGFSLKPKMLILGAGLGIPYTAEAQPVNLRRFAENVRPVLNELSARQEFQSTQYVLEAGRFIVGEAGCYLTSVLYLKSTRTGKVAICDGGMNHNQGACRHLSVLGEPYEVVNLNADSTCAVDAYSLVGPLCTPHDTFARRARFSSLAVGDVLAIGCSGAYGLTASPIYFGEHDPPKEIVIELKNGVATATDVSQFAPRPLANTLENPIVLSLPHDLNPTKTSLRHFGDTLRDLTPTEALFSLMGLPPIAILDVRSAAAFEQGHIRGARNTPLDVFPSLIPSFDGSLDYLIVGDNEEDELSACWQLHESGIRCLHYLQGGVPHWIATGLPLESNHAASTQ